MVNKISDQVVVTLIFGTCGM